MLDKQNVQFKNISEDANKYFWRFGDGNVSFQKAPKYKYNKAGKFVVELRATKDTCNTHAFFTDTIEIKIPYKASIIFDKSNICQGDSVLFKTPDLPYDSLKWYFTGSNIEYSTKDKLYVTYNQGGVFDVLLITFSKYGSDTLEKTKLINVYKFPEILFDFTL